RVYYNLSGTSGQWIPLGDFGNSFTSNFVQAIDIPVDLYATPWTNNLLYLLFADDNSVPGSDAANAIDNFGITNVVTVLSPTITAQPQSASVSPGGSVSFDVVANGSTPLFYQWRKDSNDIPDATNHNYIISNA